jgi:YVTN family beta-propeller protein
MQSQTALEFLSTYTFAFMIIAIAIFVVVLLSTAKGSNLQLFSSCNIEPLLPCEQTVLSHNSATQSTTFTVLFRNQLDFVLKFPANALNVTTTGIGSAGKVSTFGQCSPGLAAEGAQVVCNATIPGSYSPSLGTDMFTPFSLNFSICPSLTAKCYPGNDNATGDASETLGGGQTSNLYTINIASQGGTVLINGVPPGPEAYLTGGDYTIYVQPNPAYAFVSWSWNGGAGSSITPPTAQNAVLVLGSSGNIIATLTSISTTSTSTSTTSTSTTSTPTTTSVPTTTIPPSPIAVAFSPITNLAYVTKSDGTVDAINPASGAITGTIGVGITPMAVAFDPASNLAYVVNWCSDPTCAQGAVNAINTATGAVGMVSGGVGVEPDAVAFNPSGSLAYVAGNPGFGGGDIAIISPASGTVTGSIGVGTNPDSVAFDPFEPIAYVTNYGSGTVSVINTGTDAVSTIKVGTEPDAVAFDPTIDLAYVANSGSQTVNVISPASGTVIKTITVGTYPDAIAFNPSGTLAYVANYGSGTVSVINTATNAVSTISGISQPYAIAVDPFQSIAYVTNYGGTTISVINTANNAVTTIPA